MKIASLLPAATEMACALGLQENLIAISFECDHPPAITRLPRLVHTALDTHALAPSQIDEAVTARIRSGQSLYVIDETLLKSLRPDLILTQNLCQVCAPSGNELSQALKTLDYTPQILFMSPNTLADIEINIRALATATHTSPDALLQNWQARLTAVKSRTQNLPRPRVAVLEWVDPLFCAGHWLAEMIEIAGGHDPFARKGEDSVRITWQQLKNSSPEVIIIAPCGYNEAQAREQLKLLESLPGWQQTPAYQSGRIHPVDANAYLVRPGPRLIEGLELLEKLFHPI